MAFRLNWGDNAAFLLAVGGFDPQFQPPPSFPSLRRMSLSIGVGDNPSMSCNTYFALSPNTVQFGADFEFHASEAGFEVHVYFAFDALFHFSPFWFTTDMVAGVDIKYKRVSLANISLDLQLQGTTLGSTRGQHRSRYWVSMLQRVCRASSATPRSIAAPHRKPSCRFS
jgi:hypothetical protein